ncbi:NADP-dependent oxidoreductase [Nonomuraea sp. NPDC048882]|uniref:NADP-dependent oxidoreductase n=1 Tax=Nonomuraea sp. NPDC048882 TaxID=3154347 RepID=UPI0033D15977
MKALTATRYGGAETLRLADLPIPEPGPGQVQVRIAAAGLNPADLRLVSGVFKERVPLTFPHVLGSDFAGTVTAIGAGVDRFVPGDEIFGLGLSRSAGALARLLCDPPPFTTGTMAEYAVFEATTPALAPRPSGLPAEHAATLPMAALTAFPLLRAWDFAPGTKVLVVGATGGVGGAVVPLLAARGVHVIATAIPADETYVKGLGAAETIDRSADVGAETLRRHPGGLDALVNLALPGGDLPALTPVVRPGGGLFTVAFPSPAPGTGFETLYATARPGDLEEVAELAMRGVLAPTAGRRYRLEDAARAYTGWEREHVRGKLVVTVQQT